MSDADRVILQPACLRDLSWVAAFMRQADRDEVFALMADDNPLALAARLDLVTEQAGPGSGGFRGHAERPACGGGLAVCQ